MSKFVIYSLFIFVLIDLAFGWVGLIEYDPNVAGNRTGHCFTNNYNIGSLNLGQEIRIQTECAIAECNEDRSIRVSGCGMIMVPPPCQVLPGDLSKTYPECCHEIYCPPENNIV